MSFSASIGSRTERTTETTELKEDPYTQEENTQPIQLYFELVTSTL